MLTPTSRIVGCCGRSLYGGELPIGGGLGAEKSGLGAGAFGITSVASAVVRSLRSLVFHIGGGFSCFWLAFVRARLVRSSLSYERTTRPTPFCNGYHPSPGIYSLKHTSFYAILCHRRSQTGNLLSPTPDSI